MVSAPCAIGWTPRNATHHTRRDARERTPTRATRRSFWVEAGGGRRARRVTEKVQFSAPDEI